MKTKTSDAQRSRFGVALAVGTASTTVLALASYVVAPIGSAAPLWQQAWFVDARANSGLAMAAAAGITVAGFALLAVWLAVGPRNGRTHPQASPALSMKQVIILASAWAAPLLFALPLTSQDVYSYVAVGHLSASGANPYTTGINVLPDWAGFGVHPKWASTPTPYGPFMLMIGSAITTVTAPLGYLGAIAGFRLVMVGALALTAFFVTQISRRTGARSATALWAAIANPLTLISCVLAIHNDALVIAAVAGGLAAAHHVLRPTAVRLTGAWVWLTIATAIKPTAAIAYPAALRIAMPGRQPWRRTVTALATMAVGCIAALWLMLAVVGASFSDWLHAVFSTPQLSRPLWFVPVQLLTGGSIVAPEDGTTPTWAAVVATSVGVATVVAAIVISLWPTRRPAASQLALAYTVFLAGSSVIWPWYVLLWIVAVAVSESLGRWVGVLVLVTIFMTTQSLAAGFFDATALPEWFESVFNVLPGILGVVWVVLLGMRMWMRRQSSGFEHAK